MKVSLTLSGVILLASAAQAWRDHKTLVVLQKDHEALLREASELGIQHDAQGNGSLTKQARGRREEAAEREDKARDFAKRMVAFAIEMRAAEKEGKEDSSFRTKIFATFNEMLSLDASQLKIVIEEIRKNTEIPTDIREGTISFAIATLAQTEPEQALALMNEALGMKKDNESVVSEIMKRWAAKDPVAALDWIRKNAEKYPEVTGDVAKLGVLNGAAKQDPKLAFQLIGELDVKEPQRASEAIIRTAKTMEQRLAVLVALREHVKTMPDADASRSLCNSFMGELAPEIVKNGYTSATAWLEKAQLTPEEKFNFTNNLRYYETKENTGKWLEWIAKENPASNTKHAVQNIVQDWTQEDHKAVGTWLNETADSPTRQIATRTYAQQVAPYEPQTAALWAKTLPTGKERTETMKKIYREWKKQDEVAAAAFAREQGVEE